jgi:uncharacterized membrane protein YfcA
MSDFVILSSEYGYLLVVLLLTGALVGFLAGLFGVGGGAISVPAFYEVFLRLGYSADLAMPIAVGTSLAVIIPISISSALGHKRKGTLDADILKVWALPIFLGVAFGAAIASFAAPKLFQTVFASISALIALRLLTGVGKRAIASQLPSRSSMSISGFLIGLLSAIMGIGGGALSTIYLGLFNVSIHRAVSTSAAVGAIISIPGTVGYVLAGLSTDGLPPGNLGFVSIIAFIVFIPTSLLTTNIGVKLAHKLSKRSLELLFGSFLLFVSLRFFSAISS